MKFFFLLHKFDFMIFLFFIKKQPNTAFERIETLYFAFIAHKHRTYSQVKHGLLSLQWPGHQEAQQADLPHIPCLTG